MNEGDEAGRGGSTPGGAEGTEAVLPRRPGGDFLTILSGTSQNVVGIVVAAIAQLLANVLISRTLGESGF